jgi:hypothetical protein
MYDTPMIFYDFSAFHSLACLQWTCIAHQPSAYNVQALRCIHTSEPVFGFSSCLGTSALKKCGNNFDVLSISIDDPVSAVFTLLPVFTFHLDFSFCSSHG